MTVPDSDSASANAAATNENTSDPLQIVQYEWVPGVLSDGLFSSRVASIAKCFNSKPSLMI